MLLFAWALVSSRENRLRKRKNGNADPAALPLNRPAPGRMTGTTTHGKLAFEMPWQSEILRGLWQGGVHDGMALPYRFAHVVSLYRREAYRDHAWTRSKLTVTMLDSSNLSDFDCDTVFRTARYVNEVRRDCVGNEAVLVHCQAGLNRSGLVVALALMLNGDVASADEAIALLRQRRDPAVLCNPLFVEWLCAQDIVIRGTDAA